MPSQPLWQTPQIRRILNTTNTDEINELLKTHELHHLKVLSHGNHLVIYSEEDGETVSQVRFTRIGHERYQLGMATHRGRWEMTLFTGTIPELFDMVTEQFGWVLAPW